MLKREASVELIWAILKLKKLTKNMRLFHDSIPEEICSVMIKVWMKVCCKPYVFSALFTVGFNPMNERRLNLSFTSSEGCEMKDLSLFTRTFG